MQRRTGIKLKANLLLGVSLVGVLAGAGIIFTKLLMDLEPVFRNTLSVMLVVVSTLLVLYLYSRIATATCPGCHSRFDLRWGALHVDGIQVPHSCPVCGFFLGEKADGRSQ